MPSKLANWLRANFAFTHVSRNQHPLMEKLFYLLTTYSVSRSLPKLLPSKTDSNSNLTFLLTLLMPYFNAVWLMNKFAKTTRTLSSNWFTPLDIQLISSLYRSNPKFQTLLSEKLVTLLINYVIRFYYFEITFSTIISLCFIIVWLSQTLQHVIKAKYSLFFQLFGKLLPQHLNHNYFQLFFISSFCCLKRTHN